MTKNITILPADTYVVVNKTILSPQDRKLLTMLYQPIIGYVSVSLYFSLIEDMDRIEINSEELTHHHLMATMQLKLDDIVVARKKLEAIGLLKTYYRKENINHYVYALYSPLSANEFFNHPILNIVLYNNLGKKEYDKVQDYFKVPKVNLKDYEDITVTFKEVFTSHTSSSFEEHQDIEKRTTLGFHATEQIDFNLLISSIPTSMIHARCFTNEIKNLISDLSLVYNIDTLNMQGLVRSSLNEKGLIDKQELRKSCRNFYQFENGGKLPTLIYATQPEYLKQPVGDSSKRAKMIYTFETVTPYDYLKSKYQGAEPTSRDLRLIENLLVEQKMKPGVVNVLISYVLKINNQKLSKNYVETIAGQWKRLKIETVEEAMNTCEKEHKKFKKMMNKSTSSHSKQKEVVPDWFDKENQKEEISVEEQAQIARLLEDLSK